MKQTIAEMCPHCETENEITWDIDALGYKTYCPICGDMLMLCDACIRSEDGLNEGGNYCDWGKGGSDRCFRCKE